MAQFKLDWNNTDISGSANNTTQTALYRQKSLGGAWVNTGFTPANPLPKTANTVNSPVVTDNVVYQFKIDCECTQNGPVSNANGVQEMIGFAAIAPTLAKTQNTATITLNLAGTDITKAQFTLRKASDNSIVFGPYMGNKVANVATALASLLTQGTEYYWQVVLYASVGSQEINSAHISQAGAPYGPYTVTTDNPVQNLVWIADQTVCEREGGFTVDKTLSGFSSPAKAWYDKVNGLVYVADYDSAEGNVYWFNPNTATSEADATYSNAVMYNNAYNAYIDGPKRKIYFVGGSTGGLVVYNIDTNTPTVVAFGTNAPYSRITLTVGDDYIYCNDSTTALVIINRHTLAIHATIPFGSLPTPEHFNLDTQIVLGNGKAYVINNNNFSISSIGVYTPDFATKLTEIVLTGALPWAGGGSAYWQTGFYDNSSQRLYVGDIGSSKRFVIDTVSDTVINHSVLGNKSGKSNVRASWTVNPITNELIFLYAATNSTSDGAEVRRSYIEDRATHTLSKMFENQVYNALVPIEGTNKLIGVTPGVPAWVGTAGYNTDGVIQILDNSVSGMNTGKKIVVTLKQVDANASNTPTGATKNNVVGQADYIAPSTDTSACAITYNTTCPADLVSTYDNTIGKLEWEFSIQNSVRTNPNIAKIRVYAYNTGTASVEGTPTEFNSPLGSNYYSGNFTGLGGTNYTIKVKYFNGTGVEIQDC